MVEAEKGRQKTWDWYLGALGTGLLLAFGIGLLREGCEESIRTAGGHSSS
jgi:hypothetical protein